jgi:hypothetical protein
LKTTKVEQWQEKVEALEAERVARKSELEALEQRWRAEAAASKIAMADQAQTQAQESARLQSELAVATADAAQLRAALTSASADAQRLHAHVAEQETQLASVVVAHTQTQQHAARVTSDLAVAVDARTRLAAQVDALQLHQAQHEAALRDVQLATTATLDAQQQLTLLAEKVASLECALQVAEFFLC